MRAALDVEADNAPCVPFLRFRRQTTRRERIARVWCAGDERGTQHVIRSRQIVLRFVECRPCLISLPRGSHPGANAFQIYRLPRQTARRGNASHRLPVNASERFHDLSRNLVRRLRGLPPPLGFQRCQRAFSGESRFGCILCRFQGRLRGNEIGLSLLQPRAGSDMTFSCLRNPFMVD